MRDPNGKCHVLGHPSGGYTMEGHASSAASSFRWLRNAISQLEMTTAELFDALKDCTCLTPELFAALKELFERADFVKFAKHVADDKENAEALPLAVLFVTSTYQSDIEEGSSNVL